MKTRLILMLALVAPLPVMAATPKTKSVQKAPVLQWPRLSRANGGDRTVGNIMVQLLLRQRGFYKAGVDEFFGPKTEAAVKAFQKRTGLKADGVVGPQTWSKLIIRVKRGDKNDAVKAVHQVFGYAYSEAGRDGDNLASDGYGFFGPKTDQAIRRVQNDTRLQIDGIVGPQTWCILVGGEVKQ